MRESIEVVDRDGEAAVRGARRRRQPAVVARRRTRCRSSLVDATIAAEDRRFWRIPASIRSRSLRAAAAQHPSAARRRRRIDDHAAGREAAARARSASRRSSRRGRSREAREAVIALRLEHRLTKREILALYLNLAPYGNQLTGAERASRAYFGRGAALLTPAQAAFLAALPQRPSCVQPVSRAGRARARQQRDPRADGAAGHADARSACARRCDERLALAREPAPLPRAAFRRARARRVAGSDAGRRGSRRRSTRTCSATSKGIIRAERPALDRARRAQRRRRRARQRDRRVAGVGGIGRLRRRASTAARSTASSTPRQPGSALKPFTYALAFEAGESPATVLPDVPSYFPTAQDGVVYSPHNYDGQFRGPLLARRALAGSENVPAVALASRVGVPNLLRFLRAAGFTTFDKTAAYYGLGVTLGDAEVRLDSWSTAYAAFARGGVRDRADDSCADAAPAPDGEPRWSPSAPRSGSPTSCRTTRRAHLRSDAAAASSFRFRSRRRPARRRPIATTGRSATRARSPSASGSATSIGVR